MKNSLSTVKNHNISILLAPNAFKGTLTATEFCRILEEELAITGFSSISLPMCDGGDGTAAIIAAYLHAKPLSYESCDALGRSHKIIYYTNTNTAILDLADICGIKDLLPAEYDVLHANTAGLGKVLTHIVQQGISKIILGIGGSASVDGGLGALVEMGLKIVKSNPQCRNHLIGIENLEPIELKKKFKNIEWTLLCDVENVLCGPQGAAFTFAPQKGATPLQIAKLNSQLEYYAGLLYSTTGKDVLTLKYGGAAGGIAAAFYALLGARLVSGADYCLQLSGFRQLLPQVQIVITGEGKLDHQSQLGKLPGAISTLCHEYNIPVVAIAGSSEPPLPHFDQVYTLLDYAENLSASLRQPSYYLRRVAKDLKKNILKLI